MKTLARALGSDEKTVNAWVRGEKKPLPRHVGKLREVLGLEVSG